MAASNITTSSPYSHGLEKNYSFETVDLKTVRPMTIAAKKAVVEVKPNSSPQQLLLPLGPRFERRLPTLRLYESIDAINVSPFARKALVAYGISTLKDLCTVLDSLHTIKGIGHGHIDEIRDKVFSYLGPHPLQPLDTVDFTAVVRILVRELPAVPRSLLLGRFRLGHLFTETPQEVHEVAKLSKDTRRELFLKAKDEVIEKRGALLEQMLLSITEAFILPYMDVRFGLAERWELTDWLIQKRSTPDPEEAASCLELLAALTQQPFAFQRFLIPVNEMLYASSQTAFTYAQKILKIAASYHYTPEASYPLETLAIYIERELARVWHSTPHRLLRKILHQINSDDAQP